MDLHRVCGQQARANWADHRSHYSLDLPASHADPLTVLGSIVFWTCVLRVACGDVSLGDLIRCAYTDPSCGGTGVL